MASSIDADRIINAEGLVVAPGFIDPHAHAQGDLASYSRTHRENLNYLAQGVTSVVVGNDGHGTFDIAGLRETFEMPGIGTNAAMLVGFGSVRGEVMGMRDERPTDAELEEMKAYAAEKGVPVYMGYNKNVCEYVSLALEQAKKEAELELAAEEARMELEKKRDEKRRQYR